MSPRSALDPELVEAALSKEMWWSRLVFWGGAVLLGLIAVFFASICEWGYELFYRVYEYSAYLPFLICPLGFWGIWFLQNRFFKGAEGSGVPQVIASVRSRSPNLREKLLSLRVMIGKLLCTFLGLLSGASIGREGPSIHIGASLFNFLGHYARFSKFERRQGLIISGAAAGIAAAFNAPLAGIVFAIEELKGSFEEKSSGLMLSAVVLSGLIALGFWGNYSHFGEVETQIGGMSAAIAIFFIATFCGSLAGIFCRSLLYLIPKTKELFSGRTWVIPLLLGFFVAALGYFSHGATFGTGYTQTRAMLENPDSTTVFFPFLKLLASLFSYAAGIAGGVFSPSLAVGAGIGNFVSPLFSNLPLEALVVLGMVSYLAGVIRAPVTAFVIVFEMIANHEIVFPMIAAAFIATGASKLVNSTPLYVGLAEQYLGRKNPSPSKPSENLTS